MNLKEVKLTSAERFGHDVDDFIEGRITHSQGILHTVTDIT